MYMVKYGYDNIYNEFGELNINGSACWCTFWITNDFKTFYDEEDINKWIKNRLSRVNYGELINNMREEFLKEFDNINCVDDLYNIDGCLYVEFVEVDLPY